MRNLGPMDWTGIAIVVLAVVVVLSMLLERRRASSGPSLPVVRPPLDQETVRAVSDLVTRDRRIEAIKVLRDATGLGLRESKEWVDGWQPGSSAMPPTTAPSAQHPDDVAIARLTDEARSIRDASGPDKAIKHVRTSTGWGLLDAKRWVDRL